LTHSRSLALSPSYALAGAIAGAHACAAAAAALAVPGPAGWLLGAALVVLGLASAWSRALLRASRSVRGLELAPGAAQAHLAGGQSLAAEAGGHVSRYAVTLRLQDRPRRNILVTADMLDRDSFRALRIWALWRKLPGVAGKQLPV
jgi:hypothetical protein